MQPTYLPASSYLLGYLPARLPASIYTYRFVGGPRPTLSGGLEGRCVGQALVHAVQRLPQHLRKVHLHLLHLVLVLQDLGKGGWGGGAHVQRLAGSDAANYTFCLAWLPTPAAGSAPSRT